jgi:hypothetical protein
MRRLGTWAAGAALAGSAALAAVAVAAPTSTKPPTITGRAAYLSTLTCHKGTWSPDAVSFSYQWQGNGITIGTKPTVKVPLSTIGYSIACIVTARDAAGNAMSATSSAVTPTLATPKVKITRAAVAGQRITLQGRVSPRAAAKGGNLILDRKHGGDLVQLTFAGNHPRANGRFTVRVKDTVRGRHTYVLLFDPAAPGFAAQVQVKRTLTLK